MIPHHIIYRLYIWLYDKNGLVLKETLVEASSVFMLLLLTIKKVSSNKFLSHCKLADNIKLTVLDNKEEKKLPEYSGIFIQRCEESMLSPREKELMHYKTQGLSDKLAAGKLFIAPCTVNKHLKNIFEKLRVHKITQAVYKLNH